MFGLFKSKDHFDLHAFWTASFLTKLTFLQVSMDSWKNYIVTVRAASFIEVIKDESGGGERKVSAIIVAVESDRPTIT